MAHGVTLLHTPVARIQLFLQGKSSARAHPASDTSLAWKGAQRLWHCAYARSTPNSSQIWGVQWRLGDFCRNRRLFFVCGKWKRGV